MPEEVVSHSPYESLKKVLTVCASDRAYRDTCVRIVGDDSYGHPDDLSDLWAKLRTEPDRYLTKDDLHLVFSRKTHYGFYWTVPEPVLADGQRISLNVVKLKDNVEEQCWKLVEEVFYMLKSMEVTSVILGCVHPDHFGVYSHPILMLLQLPMKTPVNHYVQYCHELRAWGSWFLPGRSVLDTDRALWVFYQDAYGHKPDSDKTKTYRELFERNDWIRERHAENVLRPYFSSYGPLQQARFLLKIDANLSARIVGCEFEARIKELVDPNERQRERKIRDFIDTHPTLKKEERLRAMVEYVVEHKFCNVPHDDLREVRKCRNDAIHMLRDFNEGRWGKSAVEKMIRVTDALPKQSRPQN
jgi:hypothetical protein